MASKADRAGNTVFPKPTVVISKCLDFEACRYNGERVSFDLVRSLAPHVDYRPVCPEVEIGLGVPRDTVRLVASGKNERLVQPATGRDLTREMERFSHTFLDSLDGVDGFILKNRSPSCGLRSVKVYDGVDSSSTARHAPGRFAGAVLDTFDGLAIEDEGRLRNYRIREHFFTKLFALARLRRVASGGRMRDLVTFHATHKFVLMAYSEKHLRLMGPLVANPDKRPAAEVVGEYRALFCSAMGRAPRYTSTINVFQHIAGFFREQLKTKEKRFFARLLDRYRASQVPASSVTAVLHGWAVRFDSDYLLDQVFFEPYPEGLISVTDSGKGRAI